MDRHRLEWLFKKYFDKTISSDEQNELMRYIETASSEELTSLMENVFNFQINARTSDFFTEGQRGKMLERILSGKRQEDASLELSVLRLRKAKERKKLKLSAVAAVFLLSFTFAALLYKNYSGPAVSVLAESSVAADIPPGGDRATLTLADGSVISLNEIAGGKIADQGGVTVTKTADGLLMYTLTNVLDAQLVEERAIPVYNTITTPRGGQYQVVLPDGTKVWLNAESSLRYPALFSKTERRVELMGEGYFEVAKNDKAFFIVETDAQSVRVLGTHFNINSYQKGRRTETTLLEGSVEVSLMREYSAQPLSRILRPGEQSVVGEMYGNIDVKKTNVSNAIAWKNGLFYFNGTAIKDVMEELSRWYNFDFEFEGAVPAIKLWGSVYRNVNAAEALDILGYFDLKYRVVNNTKGETRWKVIVSSIQ